MIKNRKNLIPKKWRPQPQGYEQIFSDWIVIFKDLNGREYH